MFLCRLREEDELYESADKAFKEMLDISTDIDKAVLYAGETVVASNFPESLNAAMIAKGQQLAAMGDARAADMKSAPLTQLVIDAGCAGMVFFAREPKADGLAVLATGKKDSRIGLVFYDMKTCMRDAQETQEDVEEPEAEA